MKRVKGIQECIIVLVTLKIGAGKAGMAGGDVGRCVCVCVCARHVFGSIRITESCVNKAHRELLIECVMNC